jgi:hypothetical protein
MSITAYWLDFNKFNNLKLNVTHIESSSFSLFLQVFRIETSTGPMYVEVKMRLI